MKTFEELNTYPAPWTYDRPTQCVLDKDSWPVAELVDKRNAGVMIAAPDMYVAAFKTEAVLEKLFTLDEFAALLKSGAADALIACREELRSALAKASGEGEVR